jgi:uncharacterized protein (TIGR03000 family)
MYSVMLAAALTTGSATPDWGWHSGCYGCYGCSGCYGCCGGVYVNAFSCHGCSGCYGCYGCCGGCCGGYVVPVFTYSYGCCGGCCGGYAYPVATYGCCGGCAGAGGGSGGMSAGGGTGSTGGSGGWGMKPVPPDYPGTKPGEKPSREQLEEQVRRMREMLKAMEKQLEGTKPTKPGTEEGISTPTPAHVVVNLPADAKLFVDGVACPLTSAQRAFDTPPLEPGRTYYYSIRAEGRSLAETKRVTVRAGKETVVEFESKTAVTTASR